MPASSGSQPGQPAQSAARRVAGWVISARLGMVAAGAAVAAGLWAGAAIFSATRGFDVTDEGFYLLSYRWWHTDLRTFTGVQYLYGPVFQALGYKISLLRLVRLLTIVITHLVFGWAFMRWLRQRRPDAPASRLWEVAGVAAIVASGGMVYSWMPLSPGYNDVSLLGSLLAASIVLRMATAADRGSAIKARLPLMLGPLLIAMLLAKWTSSAVTLAVIAAAGLMALADRGPRELARVAAWVLAGALIAAALIQVFIIPIGVAVPQMIATNKLVAAGTNAPLRLLAMYATTSAHLLRRIAILHMVLLLAAIVAGVARSMATRRFAVVLGAAGLVISAWRLAAGGGLHGGVHYLHRFAVGIVGVLSAAVLVGLCVLLRAKFDGAAMPSVGREGRRGWAILAMLTVLPVTQGAGTGNSIDYMAVNAFAAWMAVIIAILTGIETAPRAARWLTAAITAGAVILPSSIATDALWSHPYRTAGHERATAAVTGVPALASVKLDPRTARAYSRLYQLLLPYIEPAGRPMMAFDEMPGIILLLGGRPVGEAWYSATDHARTAAGIRSQCRGGHGWWGSRDPVLIFRRLPLPSDEAALRSCGLILSTRYRLLARAGETMRLRVYVPLDQAVGGQQ